MDEPRSRFVDLAFMLQGEHLPREHRQALAGALLQALPWLGEVPGAAVHRLNVSAGGGAHALLSQRTRLTLRLPQVHADAAQALVGQTLPVAGCPLRLGPAQARELLPWSTLYAHLVAAADDEADEAGFLQAVQAELAALGINGRAICGRHQATEGGALQGYGLMLDHLSPTDALHLMEAGLGPHRLWGCGVFVPHKSAAAVGTPH
jgi:CRISPR-associated protein Cas6